MLELTQYVHNLIGSSEAIKTLETKDHARILVMSDSHGRYRTLINVLKLYGKNCDAFVFCGDGARDIAEVLEQANEDEEFRKLMPPVMAIVRGNGDPDVYPVCYDIGKDNPDATGLLKGSVIFPVDQTLTVNGHKFFITHGHYYNVDFGRDRLCYAATQEDCTAAFYGHTHLACEEIFPSCRCINPGSCARPRGGQFSSFAIVTVEKSFMDTAFIRAEDFKLWKPFM